MAKAQVDVSVSKYKLTIIYVKYITVILAILDIIHTTCSYFNIDAFSITIFRGLSIGSLILLYLVSYAFSYCKYHRIPLHYIVLSNCVATIDYYIGIPISDRALYCVYLIIFGIFSIWYVIDYKKSTCRNHR